MAYSSSHQSPEQVRVLLLAEEKSEYNIVTQMLGRVNQVRFAVTWGGDLEHAERAVRERNYDVILWDTDFYQGDPLAYVQQLCQLSEQSPLVALGLDDEFSISQPLFSAGVVDYLDKSRVNPHKIAHALAYARRRHVSQCPEQASHNLDPLTGLANRPLFIDRLDQTLHRADRTQASVALLLIDIDQFRQVNNSLGFSAGDALIIQVTERLASSLRKSDALARIGADEFTIILESIHTPLDVMRVVNRIMANLATPFLLQHHTLEIAASIGVALYPSAGADSEQLLLHADWAANEAKKQPQLSYRFFNSDMQREAEEALALEAQFRTALRRDQLCLHYLPTFDLASGELIGVEALVRWQHPERGLLQPDAFLALAERTGMVVPMGYWVVMQACQDMVALQESGRAALPCSINLSFKQFFDKKLFETLLRIIQNTGIDMGLLELEVSEHSLMYDGDHTRRCIKELSQYGIGFALDDFGTGYSSFANIQQLPLRKLKLDHSFIADIGIKPEADFMAKTIIGLAHTFNMQVVAEGVETEAQAYFLTMQECDMAQGHLYAKAMPFDALCRYLRGADEGQDCG